MNTAVVNNPKESVIPNGSQFLACPDCHEVLDFKYSPSRFVCERCRHEFPVMNSVVSFMNNEEIHGRFAEAQRAEKETHEMAWTQLKVGHLPYVKNISSYKDWLESFYRVTFYAFGFPADYFREKDLLEIGAGPLGILACIPHRAAITVDPLMAEFFPYMKTIWGKNILRVAAMGESLPIAAASFDAAFLINCLDHVRTPKLVLNEIYRTLKPGAFLFVMNNIKSVLGVRIKQLGEAFNIKKFREIHHPHPYSQNLLLKTIGSTGFRVRARFKGKLFDKEFSRQFTWRGRLRLRIENEHAMWLLAEKPVR